MSGGGDIRGILTTPLMITLLVITYRAYQRLPERLSEFYEHLFSILWSRHDDTKPGFIRVKRCPLNDREIRRVFDTVCFLARRDGIVEFSRQQILEVARKAIDAMQYECDDAAFVDDVRDITNLILEDGTRYSFIHKSVLEYHAAAYIAALRDDDRSEQVYTSLRQRHWLTWQEELLFLKEIDALRFNRFFLIPACESFFYKYLRRIPRTWEKTPKSVIQRLYKGHHLLIAVDATKSVQAVWYAALDVSRLGWAFMNYADRAERDLLCDALDVDMLLAANESGVAKRLKKPFVGMIPEKETGYKVSTCEALDYGAISYEPLMRRFSSLISTIVAEYQTAVESLRHHERSKSLVDF